LIFIAAHSPPPRHGRPSRADGKLSVWFLAYRANRISGRARFCRLRPDEIPMASVPTSTPEVAGGTRGLAQAVAAPLARAAIFLVATLNSGSENRATVRSFCGDIAALLRAVGFRDLEGELSCVVGFGSDAWDQLFGPPPAGEAASVPGDSCRGAPCGVHAGTAKRSTIETTRRYATGDRVPSNMGRASLDENVVTTGE